MTDADYVDGDEVAPVEIEHRCEEIYRGGRLEQRYNHLVYHFECGGRYYWARAYLDDINAVSIFGPFDGRPAKQRVEGQLDEQLLAYMRRRFREINTLGEEGYVTIWQA